MRDITAEIEFRSAESGLSCPLLKTVYLREIRSLSSAGSRAQDAALRRVDEFIVYALVRDVRFSRDRDLLDFVTAQ